MRIQGLISGLGDANYLQNIYACGACNTNNGNSGSTQLSDWQALDSSCQNQNYTGATQSPNSKVIASLTGQGELSSLPPNRSHR